MLSNQAICFVVTECTSQQKRRLINLTERLLELGNKVYFFCKEDFLKGTVSSNYHYTKLKQRRLSFFRNSLRLRTLIKREELDFIHYFGMEGVLYTLPWLRFTGKISLCFDFSPREYSLGVKVLLRPFIQRFDHLFIPSRLSNDDVWLNLRLPPSRCTSLSLMDLMFSAEGLPHFNLLGLAPLPESVKVGIYLNSSRQIALYFRLKRSLKVSDFPQIMELYLIRDRFNESLFLEQPFLGDKVITLNSHEYEKINLWLILGHPGHHPHLFRIFSNGAHLITPTSSYILELKEHMDEIISTYTRGDIRSALMRMREKSIIGEYRKYALNLDIEKEELKRVFLGYRRSLKRRKAFR